MWPGTAVGFSQWMLAWYSWYSSLWHHGVSCFLIWWVYPFRSCFSESVNSSLFSFSTRHFCSHWPTLTSSFPSRLARMLSLTSTDSDWFWEIELHFSFGTDWWENDTTFHVSELSYHFFKHLDCLHCLHFCICQRCTLNHHWHKQPQISVPKVGGVTWKRLSPQNPTSLTWFHSQHDYRRLFGRMSSSLRAVNLFIETSDKRKCRHNQSSHWSARLGLLEASVWWHRVFHRLWQDRSGNTRMCYSAQLQHKQMCQQTDHRPDWILNI